MKEKYKFIIKPILFVAILCMLLIFFSFLFAPKNNIEEAGIHMVNANGILGEREHTIDVLVVGDSESYSAISPMEMWQRYGFTSYVCGTILQPLLLSERFIERTFEAQSPTVVILETNTIFRETTLSQDIESKLESYFSVFQYHNRWKDLSGYDFFREPRYTWTDDSKGYICNAYIKPATAAGYMAYTDKVEKIPETNQAYLKNIIDLCRDNNAELVLLSTPSTVNWNYKRHNAIENFANEYGVKYLDMNLIADEIAIDWSVDTRDAGDHVNYTGSVKVSAYLGQYLKEEYDLPDHREDPAYSSWHDAMEGYIVHVEEEKEARAAARK